MKVFRKNYEKLIEDLILDGQKIVSKTLFKNVIKDYDTESQLTDENIECAFIMLCRQVPYKEVDSLSKREIVKITQGFEA